MDLVWKPDWEDARRRMEAWWEGEVLDRAAVRITAPLHPGKYAAEAGPSPELTPEELERHWTDPDVVIPRLAEGLGETWWGGEAFPVIPLNADFPAITAVFLGCPVRLVNTRTVWCDHIISDWREAPALRFDDQNPWYRSTVALLRAAGEGAPGRYYVAIPDLNGPGEILSRLRDPENLAVDLLENPGQVHEAMKKINLVWLEYWKALQGVVHEYVEGWIFWMRIWSDKPATDLQCDFSIMISNEMFREFFLPHIEQQTLWVERTSYHLDGPGALRHLDSLLELPRLSSIQWVPGAGAPPMSEWIDVLKRVQDAGKLLNIHCQPREVRPILSQLRPEGLLISTECPDVASGKELLSMVERMSARR
jgi:hypothetical protein